MFKYNPDASGCLGQDIHDPCVKVRKSFCSIALASVQNNDRNRRGRIRIVMTCRNPVALIKGVPSVHEMIKRLSESILRERGRCSSNKGLRSLGGLHPRQAFKIDGLRAEVRPDGAGTLPVARQCDGRNDKGCEVLHDHESLLALGVAGMFGRTCTMPEINRRQSAPHLRCDLYTTGVRTILLINVT